MDSNRESVGVSGARVLTCEGDRLCAGEIGGRDRHLQVSTIHKGSGSWRAVPGDDGSGKESGSRSGEVKIAAACRYRGLIDAAECRRRIGRCFRGNDERPANQEDLRRARGCRVREYVGQSILSETDSR